MNNILKIAAVVLACLVLAFFIKGGCSSPRSDTEVAKTETKSDTTYIHDTIYITTPNLIDTKPLAVLPATLPIFHTKFSDDHQELTEADTTADAYSREVELQRSEPPDSATVEIPIEQHHYLGADYEAWVSGYRAQMDSLRVFPETRYITTTTEVTKWKTRRWGLSIGAGLVATPTRIEPGVFIGATYTFFAF